MRLAPPFDVACAIAHASERWFATPTISPTFPVKSAISDSSCRRAGGVRRPVPGPAPGPGPGPGPGRAVIAEAHRPEVVLAAAAAPGRRRPPRNLFCAAGVALAVVVASVVQGLNRELGKRAGRRRLAFGPRERRAYQRSAEAAFARDSSILAGRRSRRRRRFGVADCGGAVRGLDRRVGAASGGAARRVTAAAVIAGSGSMTAPARDCGAGAAARAVHAVEHLSEQRGRLRLAARRRDLALLVFVLRVADAATRLSDFIVDHRDDGVIGDAALAWTIIVQHVAGPIPAVLHATPPKTESASRQAASVLVYLLLRTVVQGPSVQSVTERPKVC